MFIDPKNIKEEDLPLIVFSDYSSGIFQSLIKIWTKANYNHVMVMHKPGMFASQGNMFSEVPISRYMKRQNRLKFFKVQKLDPTDRIMWLNKIDRELKGVWWKRFYDWPGVLIGQFLRMRFINSPRGFYCSERVADDINFVFDLKIDPYPSPAQLNEILSNNDKFAVYGRWSGD